ncbi:MAG: endonuclease/exonuclease/phosphatase family protein [Bacteroidales bacterium]|nr:endonuclease/exonuclease/phosphatase family protein [Bacteroidales bacterium]
MSYNIRYNEPSDGIDSWEHRKDFVAMLIMEEQPDIIGLQEVLIGQLEDLADRLPYYAWTGVGRDDGERAGEFTAIMFDTKRLKLISDSTVWCSETPERPSRGWDAVSNRTITRAHFYDMMSGKEYVIFNTHFDHVGDTARKRSAILLLDLTHQVDGRKGVIVSGDFNCGPDSAPIRLLVTGTRGAGGLNDARSSSDNPPEGPKGTYNGFNPEVRPEVPVDYIFTGPGFEVISFRTVDRLFDGRCPSDHFPVITTLIYDP